MKTRHQSPKRPGRDLSTKPLSTRLRPFALCLAALLVAAPASADTAGDKALRGIANILTCPMALPGEIHDAWNEGGPALGLTKGVALGIGMMPARALVGAFELVTSPAPWPRRDFGPILRPPYTWQYFED